MKPPLVQGNPDDFQTPPQAIIPLLPYISKDKVIWECSCGQGQMVQAFKDNGYSVVFSDILNGDNFITSQPKSKYDVIVTNPPYSIKQQFLQRAYQLGKPFAFLLPLTTFQTKKRQDLFKQYGLQVILFDKRINFKMSNNIKKSQSWFATAWFTHGLNIGKQLTFVSYTG